MSRTWDLSKLTLPLFISLVQNDPLNYPQRRFKSITSKSQTLGYTVVALKGHTLIFDTGIMGPTKDN